MPQLHFRQRTVPQRKIPKPAIPVPEPREEIVVEPSQAVWPIELINSSSLFELVLPAIVLIAVGKRIVEHFPGCRLWGCRTAALVLIGYVGTRLSAIRPTEGALLLSLIVRGLLFAGMVLGSTWSLYPIVATTWDILTQIVSFTWKAAARIGRFCGSLPIRIFTLIWPKHRMTRAKRLEMELREREEEQWRQTRARQSAEQQQRERERQLAEKKRREDARFTCQVFYDRHRAAIHDKLSPSQLQDYFQRYLADTLLADEVERRAEQLKEMILNIADGVRGPRPRFTNLAALREHFKQQQLSVTGSDFSVDIKESLIVDLAREEMRAIREFRQV